MIFEFSPELRIAWRWGRWHCDFALFSRWHWCNDVSAWRTRELWRGPFLFVESDGSYEAATAKA